jgi:FkbM family methyltransferase
MTIAQGAGAGLLLDPGNSNPAYGSGNNELPVQGELLRHLAPGAIFYDVGANVGFFSVIAARIVGPRGSVFAFEPVSTNARYIRRNARLNKLHNIVLVRKAVTDSIGRADLCVTEYAGGAVLASADHRSPDVVGTTKVDTVSIDHLVFDLSFPAPTVVKIDVEGAESSVLRGMKRVLMEFGPVVIYELDDVTPVFLERKQRQCEDLLLGCGYRLTRLDNSYPDGRCLVTHTVAVPAATAHYPG